MEDECDCGRCSLCLAPLARYDAAADHDRRVGPDASDRCARCGDRLDHWNRGEWTSTHCADCEQLTVDAELSQ